jgi:hypothetical protein
VHLTSGPLAHILSNRHYLGEINHRGQSWPGEHAAIIEAETFAKVQANLGRQRLARSARLKSNALLMGKLFDETGERLTPSYAIKQGVRYRYYISTSAMQARDRVASSTHRLQAAALETVVIDALAFLDPVLIDAACSGALPRGYGVTRLMDLPPRFADQWRALGLQRPA